jgi:hypothetical protein
VLTPNTLCLWCSVDPKAASGKAFAAVFALSVSETADAYSPVRFCPRRVHHYVVVITSQLRVVKAYLGTIASAVLIAR